MLGKKSFGKVDKVGDNPIVRVRPKRRKFKALTGSARARGVGIIFCVRPVADNKNLHVVKKSATRPKRISAVTIDLIKRLANGNAAPFQLDVHERETVYQNRHVVAVGVPGSLRGADFVLIDNLQAIVMDIGAVDERDIFRHAVIAL